MSKTKNYTKEDTKALVDAYAEASTPEGRMTVVTEWAKKLDKSLPSIRAKLTREGVYVAKSKAEKKTTVRKADLVTMIAKLVDAPEESLDSLEKVTKNALTVIANALVSARENS